MHAETPLESMIHKAADAVGIDVELLQDATLTVKYGNKPMINFVTTCQPLRVFVILCPETLYLAATL